MTGLTTDHQRLLQTMKCDCHIHCQSEEVTLTHTVITSETKTSKSSTHQILWFNHCYSYKLQFHIKWRWWLQVTTVLWMNSTTKCEWWNVPPQILFSGEANFHVSEKVNSQNNRYWSATLIASIHHGVVWDTETQNLGLFFSWWGRNW